MEGLAAVTFDFHNTLVSGAGWLHLEIVTLPGEVLRRLVAAGDLPVAAAAAARLAAAETAYRALREEAKGTGREVEALAGVLRVFVALGWAGRVPRERVAAALEAAQRACLAETALIPGVPEALAAVDALGLARAVISSATYPPFVHWGLARHGLAAGFPVVATSAATGFYKSDPRLYRWALAQLGVPPAQAVHVGDHPRFDVAGAQAAGMRAILLDRGADRGPEAPAPLCTPDATITHMADLPAALAALARAR